MIGHWGPVTSTLDWCEENYHLSRYIAEFWNTFTNLLFVGLALFTAARCTKLGLYPRFTICYLFLALIGFGSFLFHATLRYEYQLLDELPMIFGACHFLFCLLSNADPLTETRIHPRHNELLAICCGALGLSVSAGYVYLRNPVFHEISYGIIMTINTYLYFRHIRHTLHLVNKQLPSTSMSATTLWLGSMGFMAAGFFLWNIDNLFCNSLLSLRKIVEPYSSAFSALLQLHAWWHILTLVSGMWYIAGCTLVFYQKHPQAMKDGKQLIVSRKWVIIPMLEWVAKARRSRSSSKTGAKIRSRSIEKRKGSPSKSPVKRSGRSRRRMAASTFKRDRSQSRSISRHYDLRQNRRPYHYQLIP